MPQSVGGRAAHASKQDISGEISGVADWSSWVGYCIRPKNAKTGPTLRSNVRRQLLVLSILSAVVVMAAWSARDVRVDTRVEALLPRTSASVRAIHAARATLPVDQPLTVLIESSDPERNRTLATQVADELQGWPETEWVMTRYGFDAIVERALYYVDLPTLQEWRENAEEALDWEVCEASPVCVTIADPPVLPTDDDVRDAVDRAPAGTVLRALTGSTARTAGATEAEADEFCNDDGSVCAVQALLTGDAGDLGFARQISDRANAFLASLEATQPPGTKIRLVGRYRVAPMEHAIIMTDLQRISLLAAFGSLLVVLLFFRDVRALLQLAVPMLSGLVVAIGLIVVVQPKLNLISASALAILAGMAIDFGIHLLMHAQSTHVGARPEAGWRSVRELWVALVVAGVTTALGFAALSLTKFQGFSQMGWMASLGILVTLGWTLVSFPTVVSVVPARLRRGRDATPTEPTRGTAIAGLVVAALAIPLAVQVEFERNLAGLQPKVVHHSIDSEVLRARRHLPVVFFGDEADAVSAAVRGPTMTSRSTSVLGVSPVVVSAQTLFPHDLGEKAEVLDGIRATLERARAKAEERDDADALAEIEALEPWLAIEGPPSPASLPPWLTAILVAPDGSVGERGIAYVPLRGSNAEAMEDLAAWLTALRDAHPGVTFASAEAMLGEVTPALVRDAPRILALVFLGLIFATGLASRSFVVTRDVFMTTAISTILFVGMLHLFGISLHLYNLLAVPVVIGLAVDGAVHMRWALRDGGDPERLRSTSRAVAASTLTSMVAFLALATASHPGLRSLGWVGALGLGTSLAVNLVWLPAWVRSAPRPAPEPQAS